MFQKWFQKLRDGFYYKKAEFHLWEYHDLMESHRGYKISYFDERQRAMKLYDNLNECLQKVNDKEILERLRIAANSVLEYFLKKQ